MRILGDSMKKLFLLSCSIFLMGGLFAKECSEEENLNNETHMCEKCEKCNRRHRCRRKKRDYYDDYIRRDQATWPGKMEDSFMEQMMP